MAIIPCGTTCLKRLPQWWCLLALMSVWTWNRDHMQADCRLHLVQKSVCVCVWVCVFVCLCVSVCMCVYQICCHCVKIGKSCRNLEISSFLGKAQDQVALGPHCFLWPPSLEVTSGCPCDEAVPPEHRSLHPSLSSPTWRPRDVCIFSLHISDSRFQWKVSYFLSPGLHKSQMLDVTWSLWWRILCLSRHERNTGDWIGFCRRASEGLRALETKPQEK